MSDLFAGTDDAPEDDAGDSERASVVPAAPVENAYDYAARPGLPVGAYVTVPFGGRTLIGVIWDEQGGQAGRRAFKGALKPLISVLEAPPMREATRRFLERAARYTMTPLGEMVRLATRAPQLDAPVPTRILLRRGAGAISKPTPARMRALDEFDALAGGRTDFSIAPTKLAAAAGVGSTVIRALLDDGALAEVAVAKDPPYPALDPNRPGRPLSDAQADAAATLCEAVADQRFRPCLLHGVTGAGKTEAYLEAVAEALRQGRQALVLLPEIALTEAFLTRLTDRFGARPAEWHSAAKGVERRRCWRAVASGQARVVVGARSALFLPFKELGLIVVDEEHDGGYKQDDGAIYNARDMAVLRAHCEGAAVVLASATPSLESWVNAGGDRPAARDRDAETAAAPPRYQMARLTTRFGPAVEPTVATIDLKDDPPARDAWVAPSLAEAVAETVARGEQAMLFLNRRGYAPLTICRRCGERLGCPHCDSWLVLHRLADRVLCHLCGHEARAPKACPSCGSDELAACGPGVERLAEEAAALFPDARLSLISSDLVPSPDQLKAALASVTAGEVDIVIGTQIVAKGHNFPKLTLVGVVDADLGLQGGDFRAAERTFQLLRQVAGRAGRADRPGRALIQTHAPDHAVMRALCENDEQGFLRLEADLRRRAGAPPYGRYLAVILSGPSDDQVMDVGAAYQRLADPMRAIGAQVLGPAPAPIPRIRGKFRARLLVKAPKDAPIQAAAAAWSDIVGRARIPGRAAVRVVFDVDPISFL